jgi:hypothetical protein
MSKLCLTTIACLSIALAPTAVFAGSLMADPVYFGGRSVNPEKETYAYPGLVGKGDRICFVGPAASSVSSRETLKRTRSRIRRWSRVKRLVFVQPNQVNSLSAPPTVDRLLSRRRLSFAE